MLPEIVTKRLTKYFKFCAQNPANTHKDSLVSIDLNGYGIFTRMSLVQFDSNLFIIDDESRFENSLFRPLD